MIDRATIERIKDAADIVDVVSEFVSLKRVGSNYRGLCPFHNDHSPSFYVSPNRGTCHCFTCGEGGDAVGFLIKHEQLTYPEALRWLAKRYGIEIREEELSEQQKKEESEREGVLLANEWASKYFEDILHNDIDGRAVGMQYFRSRGFRDDIIRRFHLGFSLADNYALGRKAKEEGRSPQYLCKAGICFPKGKHEPDQPITKDDVLLDRFAGRAMFPWFNVSGKVVAFGGRVLDKRTKGVDQKYVNSPETPVYKKDHELYGIFQAKRAIGKEDCVYMVEGYTDVISMHQCGIENVVANSGTALSKHQIRLLHRFTENIVLLYDGDDAGIHAALRGTDMLLQDGMNVKVMLLPDGDDPDSFARKHNAAEFKAYIEEHQTDFIEFKTRVLLNGVSDARKRSEAINSIIRSISVIGDPIVRATYIKDCSSRLGIAEQTLITTMNDFIRNNREEQRKESERERNRQQNGYQQQPSQQTAQQSQQSQPQTPQQSQQSQQSSAPQQYQNQGGYDSQNVPPQYEDYPPEAFLPPEAFSDPQSSDYSSPANPAASGGSYQQTTQSPNRGYQQPTQPSDVTPLATDVQSMLMRAILKYGERIMYDNVEAEDGSSVSLTVAQYVHYDLSADGLMFRNPTYNQILSEAVEHAGEESFVAEKYFIRHPDYEVSSIACRLTEDAIQLSKSHSLNMDQNALCNHIQHLVLDFRREYVDERLNALRTEIGLASNDHDKLLSLMGEYQKLQNVRNVLAKKLGTSVFAK